MKIFWITLWKEKLMFPCQFHLDWLADKREVNWISDACVSAKGKMQVCAGLSGPFEIIVMKRYSKTHHDSIANSAYPYIKTFG